MIPKSTPRIIAVILIALIVLGAVNAIAASNTVPMTHLIERSTDITANDLKPPACTMVLTNVVSGSGLIFGTTGNDLMAGGANADIIFAFGGDDCILGGDANDTIYAGAGTDVCIGGPGTDSFNQCETQIQ